MHGWYTLAVFLECSKCVLLYETGNSSCEAQSRRIYGWITVAERKLDLPLNQQPFYCNQRTQGQCYHSNTSRSVSWTFNHFFSFLVTPCLTPCCYARFRWRADWTAFRTQDTPQFKKWLWRWYQQSDNRNKIKETYPGWRGPYQQQNFFFLITFRITHVVIFIWVQ